MPTPGGGAPAVEYLKRVLTGAGIEFTSSPSVQSSESRRPAAGNGKRPLLLIGHTDTVNVDVSKWTFPPFSAARDGGYIYGRWTVDDKDNVSASLIVSFPWLACDRHRIGGLPIAERRGRRPRR